MSPVRPLPALMLAAAAPAIASAAEEPAPVRWAGTQWAQVRVRERIIIRIPRMPVAPAPSVPAALARARPVTAWAERKAAKCVPAATLTGASFSGEAGMDLMTGDGRRLRAILDDDCHALDFYSGFYLKPAEDGNICAKRDAIRSRSGARCLITGFRTLVPRR